MNDEHQNASESTSRDKARDDAFALGQAKLVAGDLPAAQTILRQILAKYPSHAESLHLLGVVTLRLGRVEESIELMRQSLAIAPDVAAAHANLGCALMQRHLLIEAQAHFERAIAIKDDFAEAHNNLGALLARQDRHAEAMAHFEKAIAIQGNFAGAHDGLGMQLVKIGRVEEALTHFDAAIAIDRNFASAHMNRALAWLALGQYRQAWIEYEARWQMPGMDFRLPGPQWDGSDPTGKNILVHWEQGFGDTIQFARYVTLLAERGARISLLCQPALERLLGRLPGVCRTVVHAIGSALPPYDARISVISLARIFNTALETIPSQVPYLQPAGASLARWHGRLGAKNKFRVGLVWASKPGTKNWRRKSISASDVLGLLDVPGAEFFGLYVGAPTEDLETLKSRLTDLSPELADFEETAAAMCQMDLILTVDTAVAHLAGALGLPVWIMLPYVADWRWLRERADSPWYPTARLFRQPDAGNWPEVVSSVKQELRRMVR